MTCTITHDDLSQYYGSDQLFFNPLFRGINYTQGVQYVSRNGAGWLVDAILSHAIHTKAVAREDFILAKLKVNLADHTAILTFDDGNGKIVARQAIDYTDFPLPEISFYLEGKTLMLPSER
jgi:hypothetical protein